MSPAACVSEVVTFELTAPVWSRGKPRPSLQQLGMACCYQHSVTQLIVTLVLTSTIC